MSSMEVKKTQISVSSQQQTVKVKTDTNNINSVFNQVKSTNNNSQNNEIREMLEETSDLKKRLGEIKDKQKRACANLNIKALEQINGKPFTDEEREQKLKELNSMSMDDLIKQTDEVTKQAQAKRQGQVQQTQQPQATQQPQQVDGPSQKKKDPFAAALGAAFGAAFKRDLEEEQPAQPVASAERSERF